MTKISVPVRFVFFKFLPVALMFLFPLASIMSAEAGSRKAKIQKGTYDELKRPETMLGYGEIMRLKPAGRRLYLHRVANMLVDLSRMPSSRPQRILFDAQKLTPSQLFETMTWPMILFPFAHAAPAADGNICANKENPSPIKVGKVEVRTSNCKWDATKNEAGCEKGSSLISSGQGPNYRPACVAEKDLRKALGDRLSDEWKKAEGACKKQNPKNEPHKSGEKTKDKSQLGGKPCVYAGWTGKSEKTGSCPRSDAPKKFEMGGRSFEFTCLPGGGTVVCNPAIFGVVAADSKSPGRFTAVCVEPSIHATENCRALSLQPNEKLDTDNKDENLWNPDMKAPKPTGGAPSAGAPGTAGTGDSFGAFRANPEATQKLFESPGFADFFNQTGGEIGDFCASGSQSGDNMTKFCVECRSMANKLEIMNRGAQGAAGTGASGPEAAAAAAK
jgi:hypothetical protein